MEEKEGDSLIKGRSSGQRFKKKGGGRKVPSARREIVRSSSKKRGQIGGMPWNIHLLLKEKKKRGR